MHLVEDAAVPDHTRNDYWHGPRAYFLNSTTFERWTDANLDMFSFLPVSAFTKEQVDQIFGEEGDAPAPVPISRIFDMNLHMPGTRPSITGQTLAGIAEYSNSNFLSYATIFKDYTYPALESTEPLPGSSYLRKVKDGEAIDHLVRFRRFDDKITYSLDPATYHDYASLILPKSAAYASLIPYYFFRASLQIRVVYNCWTPEIPPVIYVFNNSSEMMDGQLDLYVGGQQTTLRSGHDLAFKSSQLVDLTCRERVHAELRPLSPAGHSNCLVHGIVACFL
jgi:hypothetical protein